MPIPTVQERLGTLLAERFEFRGLLARGGMGVLFEGVDHETGAAVVIKLPGWAEFEDPRLEARFVSEARALRRTRHPNIVAVVAYGEDGPGPYLVMERLHGQTLAERLFERGPLALEEALCLLLPIFGAMAHVHDCGITHRDLKPSNIFLAETAQGTQRPTLLDFGIAKSLDTDSLTATGGVVGTPRYMSPEQAAGLPVGPYTDVWAMGTVLRQCLENRHGRSEPAPTSSATEADNSSGERHTPAPVAPRDTAKHAAVPTRVTEVIDRALARDPAARYLHMRDFARALVLAARDVGTALPDAPDPVGLPEYALWRAAQTTTQDASLQLPSLESEPEEAAPEPRSTDSGSRAPGRLGPVLGALAGLAALGAAALVVRYEAGTVRLAPAMQVRASGQVAATNAPSPNAPSPQSSPIEGPATAVLPAIATPKATMDASMPRAPSPPAAASNRAAAKKASVRRPKQPATAAPEKRPQVRKTAGSPDGLSSVPEPARPAMLPAPRQEW